MGIRNEELEYVCRKEKKTEKKRRNPLRFEANDGSGIPTIVKEGIGLTLDI